MSRRMLLRRGCRRALSTFPGFHHDSAKLMPRNNFGAALDPDRTVSALSFGAAALGHVFRDIDEAEGEEVVVEAVRRGINLIDCAPWYGLSARAETVLGRALKRVPREAYLLQTKVGRYNTEKGVADRFDFSFSRTLKSVDESLERLGVDFLDCIQVHDPEFAPSLDVIVEETIPALQEVVRKGKARAIGITGYPLEVLLELARRAPAASLISAISYCHYNLHSTKLVDSGTATRLRNVGLGIINASPLSMGLLTPSGPPPWHPASDELKKRVRDANSWLLERGCDISRLGLAFCLQASTTDKDENGKAPLIATTMTSTASMKELHDAIDLATGKKPLTKHEADCLSEVRRLFFTGSEAESVRSWEGKEVDKYWTSYRLSATNGR